MLLIGKQNLLDVKWFQRIEKKGIFSCCFSFYIWGEIKGKKLGAYTTKAKNYFLIARKAAELAHPVSGH